MRGLEEVKEKFKKDENMKREMKCGEFKWEVNYFDKDGKVKVELFSDIAEGLVKECLDPNLKFDYDLYKMDEEGNYFCQKPIVKNNKKIWKNKECPENQRKKEEKKLSLNQMRKFYDEILSFQTQIENAKNKEEKFRELLPYIKMEKAKANLAYQKKNINTNFKRFIDLNIDYILDGYDKNLGKSLEKFNIFVSLFEAVIAYSKGIIKEN